MVSKCFSLGEKVTLYPREMLIFGGQNQGGEYRNNLGIEAGNLSWFSVNQNQIMKCVWPPGLVFHPPVPVSL